MCTCATQVYERVVTMKNNPFVSIVILNYKRRDTLIKVLESSLRQNYPLLEVIVVDNGSGDGTVEFLEENYPDVRTVALEKNIGCAGRNKGIEAARGDVVVTIDNDVYFDSADEVVKIVRFFDRHPDAACVSFKVHNPYTGGLHARDWCHPRDYREYSEKEFETYYIPEGASAFRKEALDEVGGYYEPLFIGCEGYDLALRMIDRGYKIMYTPDVLVWHSMEPETRESWRPYYYYTRNYFWIAWKDYRFFSGLRYIVPKISMMLYFSVRTKFVKYFFKGVFDGLANLGMVSRDSTRIKRETEEKIKALAVFRPGLLSRFRKHLAKPQI